MRMVLAIFHLSGRFVAAPSLRPAARGSRLKSFRLLLWQCPAMSSGAS